MTTDLERYRERGGVPFASEDAYQQLVPLRNRLKALLSKQETAENKRAASIVSRILTVSCLLALTLGLAPMASLLLAWP